MLIYLGYHNTYICGPVTINRMHTRFKDCTERDQSIILAFSLQDIADQSFLSLIQFNFQLVLEVNPNSS